MLLNHILKSKNIYLCYTNSYVNDKKNDYKWFNDDRITQLGYLIVVPNMCLKFATD